MEFMPPNFGNVYLIPESQPELKSEEKKDAEQASVEDVYSILDSIYQSQGINELKNIQFERWVSPVCERIERIGRSIEDARSLEMDRRFYSYDFEENDTNLVKSVFRKLFQVTPIKQLLPVTRENLINEESKIGSQIFGDQPDGEKISFFYYGKDDADRERWYCKKEKFNQKGNRDYVIMCFEIQNNAILKVITKSDGSRIAYEYLNGKELESFIHSTEIYHNQVMKKLYGHEGSLDDDFKTYSNKISA